MAKRKMTKAGAFVESLRLEKGMEIKEFCEELGISKSSYYDKRVGDTNFTEEEKIRIKLKSNLSREDFYEKFFSELEEKIKE
jgi:transcriptional regulator with XRE-family HTH domain